MTMMNQTAAEKHGAAVDKLFHVVHPLDDVLEEKLCPTKLKLGLMRMSGGRWWSLLTLRVYLVVIILLVTYRGLNLAGVFSHSGH